MMRRRCWHGPKSKPRKPISTARSQISSNSTLQRARRRKAGSKRAGRDRPRPPPPARWPAEPPTPSGSHGARVDRVTLFLASVAVIAAGFAWIADRPGEVAVTWMGYRIETSVMVAAFAVAVLISAVLLIWTIVRGVLRSPEQVSLFFRHRRAMRGYLAVSRGLIAIGAGDSQLARRSAGEAARLSPGDPLALLLTAQSAQMAGDRTAADPPFPHIPSPAQTSLLA